MKIKLLFGFCVILFHVAQGQITYTNVPLDNQLIARNINTNFGEIVVQGDVNSASVNYTSILMEVYREGVLYDSEEQTLSYSSNIASFNITSEILAEQANYSIKIYGKNGASQTLEKEVDNIVAGDVFIIQGQSNAEAKMREGSANGFQNNFVRVYASGTDNASSLQSNNSWYIGQGDGDRNSNGNTGQWGLKLADSLVKVNNIPVAIFNGARGGKEISYFQAPLDYQTSLNSNYGRLYHRLKTTGLQDKVRAIFWAQGERDADPSVASSTNDYKNAFNTLKNSWLIDYPNIEEFFIFQTKNGCGKPIDNLMQVKEAQRELATENNDISIMSTAAIPHYTDECHFAFENGYRIFADRIFPLVERDLYGVAASAVDPPMIIDAYLSDITTLVVETDTQTLKASDNMATIASLVEYFELSNAGSVQITGVSTCENNIIFSLSGNPGANAEISFVGPYTGAGSFITNAQNIEIICFYKFPVKDVGIKSVGACSLFVTTWNTEAGDPGSTEITLPITTGAYDVDTNNDGIYDLINLTGIQTIDLGSAGTHTIAVRLNASNTSNELRVEFNNGNNAAKLTTINQWGGNIVWTSMEKAFYGCSNMNIDAGAGEPNLSMVTSMSQMFNGAKKLNQNLNNWDVSNVTNMSWMFKDSGFEGEIGNWDVSNVTNMAGMFINCTSFNSNISNWDVSNVTNMGLMFWNNYDFSQDISNWNVSNVTNMSSMLRAMRSFNHDIGNWDVSNVTNMSNMLNGATIFNQDIGSWNVSNVTNMENMFQGTTNFSSANYDALLSGWSQLTLQNNITFTAPPASYCMGEAGRDILTNTYNWTITGDTGLNCSGFVFISGKAFLQGPYDSGSGLMNDDLRVADVIPATSPYADNLKANKGVFATTGSNAIVDWVWIELRDKSNINNVLYSSSAFLQRDGDIVHIDGSSNLGFMAPADDFYISVNHRNHVIVATNTVASLSGVPFVVDFTVANNVQGTTSAMSEVVSGVYALFAGDVDQSKQVQLVDRSQIITVLGQPGYSNYDVNLNGQIQVSDISLLLTLIGSGIQF